MQIGETGKQGICPIGKIITASEDKRQEQADSVLEKDISKKNGVTVDISEQALEMFKRQLEEGREAADAAGKAAADQSKILEIARRISRGDKVPPKDEKKLMEYDFKLYQMAKMSAMLNEKKKHKEHKSLFEDEEENNKREKLRALEDGSFSADSIDMEGSTAETGSQEAEG